MGEQRTTYTLADGTEVNLPAHVQVLSGPELIRWFQAAYGDADETQKDTDDPR